MGNSEVGHLNIGAGRVVMQELPRISHAAEDGSLARAPALVEFIARLKASGGTCHLLGLLSPGGVHSHQEHAVALAKILHEAGVKTVVHAFTDGRDSPPRSGADDIAWLRKSLPPEIPIATVSGPLLCDGPRQALGSGCQGVRRHGRGGSAALRRRQRGDDGGLCARRDRRIRRSRLHRRIQGHAGRRRHPVLQLPRRPGARNPRAPCWSRISTASPASG